MNALPADIFNGEVDPASAGQYMHDHGYEYACPDAGGIAQMIRPRKANAHKGVFGHTLIIAGSEGKAGAAILSCAAALRTGCGLVTALVPQDAIVPMLSALPEAMPVLRNDNEVAAAEALQRYQSVGFGPGVGMQAGNWLLMLLQNAGLPLVIDADGLTLLSQHADWYSLLAANILLTPHPGEFDRLTKKHDSVWERCQSQMQFSKTWQVYVLLKGQYTSVTTPNGKIFFNTTGNNGMATAGSGDVLTGIIASLLAQGYPVDTAVVLGAYLHGFAGDRAAEMGSKTSMIASDIVQQIPQFFKVFEK